MSNLNPAYVIIPFKQLLANCHNNVLLGLRLVEKIDKFPDPTNEELQLIQIQLSLGNRASDISQTKELFKRWLLINGFEDIHSCIRTTLERLFVFKAIENQLNDNPSLAIEGVEPDLKIRANKFNYPDLLNAVHTELKDTLTYERHLKTINKARNCLVHRNGVIEIKDCNNDQKDKLIIVGNRFKMFFKKGDEEVLAEVGKSGPENAALMLGAEEFNIEFNIGDKLDITLKQFIDILNTCIFFNADVEEKIKGKKT
ncbi:hypothetical protein [Desulfobacula sp.]|uniref:hypothetical protein n=1 Tax=Desulfobacula sp. TaxID=2593537 RepID=UPI0027146B98|nr:hypothetical protein [Desulfobacula sp.]